jgi:hypothetical protein
MDARNGPEQRRLAQLSQLSVLTNLQSLCRVGIVDGQRFCGLRVVMEVLPRRIRDTKGEGGF